MKIDDIDLQPCDGSHVRKTAEVGQVAGHWPDAFTGTNVSLRYPFPRRR